MPTATKKSTNSSTDSTSGSVTKRSTKSASKPSTKSTPREVEFEFWAPQASSVVLAGSFNGWDTKKVTLVKDRQGKWSGVVELSPGRYEYRYVVDGNWCNDQKRNEAVANPFGSSNSVIEIK